MKKKIFIFLSIVIVLFIFFKITQWSYREGQISGAQQYVKKMFNTNNLQISTNDMMDKINVYRKKNNLDPFEESIGLCKLAEFEAKNFFKQQQQSWDKKTGKYIKSYDTESQKLTRKKAQELCPKCNFGNPSIENLENTESYAELRYIILRPDLCSELQRLNAPIQCKGDESFGVVEHISDRVINGWINNEKFRKILLSEVKNACIRSYAGAVILSIGTEK